MKTLTIMMLCAAAGATGYTKKRVTYFDLPENPAYGQCLYCVKCCGTYSCHRSDYFMVTHNNPFKCCKRNMWLVTKQESFT